MITTYLKSIIFTLPKNWGHVPILCEVGLPQDCYNINLSLRANFEDERFLVLGRLLT